MGWNMNNQILNQFVKRDRYSISHRERVQPPNKCVSIEHKSRMNRFKVFFITLLVSIALLSWSSCTNSDPAIVALEATSFKKGIAAVAQLTDQSMLAKVAKEAKHDKVREAAVAQLTDPSMLVNIAVEDKHLAIRKLAVEKLTNQSMLTKLSDIDWDKKVQIFYKVILAFNNVPDNHRVRLIGSILPVIHVLSKPEVVNIFGEIVSIMTNWSSKSQTYYPASSTIKLEDKFEMLGELFKCSIKLKNLHKPLSHAWATNFLSITYKYTFAPAIVNAGDLLGPVFERLSESLLAKFTLEDWDKGIRKAAIEELTDQTKLEEFAVGDKNFTVRIAAVKKLTNQSLLAKIALKDWHEGYPLIVRLTAIRKLTDHTTLGKIAAEDKSGDVRIEAKERLKTLRSTGQ